MSYGLPSYVIMAALVTALETMVATRKGLVTPAHDPAEALDLLASAPEKWRVIVAVDDEDNGIPDPGSGEDAVSDTEFVIICQAGLGLAANPGKQIYSSRANASPSVLEIAEGVRSFMRGLAFTHADIINCPVTFRWMRSTWVAAQKTDGTPALYGRQHVFRLQHRIELPADVEPVAITWPAA